MADGPFDGQDPGMPDPEELRRMMEELLAGRTPSGISFDASALAKAAGLPSDPAFLRRLMTSLQQAANTPDAGIDWTLATDQAKATAAPGTQEISAQTRSEYEAALAVAGLWLSEVTSITELTEPTRLVTRTEWIGQTMPVWSQISAPVATSIAQALTRAMRDNAPEQLAGMLERALPMMQGVAGALFAVQLGQVVGQLSAEVVSGGDVGIPLLERAQSALVPQNIDEFGAGLELPADQVRIALSVRELAHARLFRHAKWLRLDLISAITAFADGVDIDMERIGEVASGFDPSNPEALREALSDGSLIPEHSPAQRHALSRLETTLALIEGWVDVVTEQASTRLPGAAAIAETVRRRRATGGPAERALATLVGLELRPRRLREAAAMWRLVGEELGAAARDGLWAHPDLLPTSEDIDDPAALVARLRGEGDGSAAEDDAFDQAIAELLRDDAPRPIEDEDGRIEDPDDPEGPEGPAGPGGSGGPGR